MSPILYEKVLVVQSKKNLSFFGVYSINKMTIWIKVLIVVAVLSLLFGAQKLPSLKEKVGKKEKKKSGKEEEEESKEEETWGAEEKEEESKEKGKVKCPVCGKEFDSERGMKIHKSKVH